MTRFEPDGLVGQVPPRGLRYLTHAIAAGTVLAREAMVTYSGRLRLKPDRPWLPFQATELIGAGRSYRVSARAGRGPLRATIEDVYEGGRARSRLRAFGTVTIRSERGDDLARSARGRLVVDSTWLPSAFLPSLGVRWSDEDGNGVRLSVPVDGEDVDATLGLGADGALRAIRLPRWSNLTPDGRYDWVPFSARVEAERTFGGYTIPSAVTAVWHLCIDQAFEFFHAAVSDVQFRP
jgi:hypothetical protein